ncbi:MAG: DUF885 domain-containing protein [Bacteroidota bacterium]
MAIDTSHEVMHFLDSLSPGRSRGLGLSESDMSVESFNRLFEKTQKQLARLHSFDTAQLAGDLLIDWKFAESLLAGREIDQKAQRWRKDPRVYMAFTGVSAVIESPASNTRKISQVNKNLILAAQQLANGRSQLDTFVPRFQELGLFMAENGRALFEKELPDFIRNAGDSANVLIEPSKKAKEELELFIGFLRDELPKKPLGSFVLGATAYNEMLQRQFLLGYDADSLFRFGKAQFEKTLSELEGLAKKIDPKKTWQQLATEIKNEYPNPQKMIEAHQEWVDKSKEHVLRNNLIPIPWKERVRVVPRVPYLRKTSYYGNFSVAKMKDKDSIFTSEWNINPFEEQWDEKRKKEYLVEHDWGVIMVTAPHETYAGHHIQGLYQRENPSKLRRENSISIFGEGWGLYNEQLFRETGFYPNDKIVLRQLQLRLWRNARVIYDVGMHTERMTYDEAVKLMTEEVGFLPWAAQLEIDAACASPGYFIGYFTGMMEILKMREDYKKLKGEKFSLSEFHEQLLRVGSMPIQLMRDGLWLEENQH